MRALVLMTPMFGLTAFHHAHHLRAACSEKDNAENDEDDTENDVQHGGVVEGNRRVDDCRMEFRRDPSERLEQRFDHECRKDHRKIEGHDCSFCVTIRA